MKSVLFAAVVAFSGLVGMESAQACAGCVDIVPKSIRLSPLAAKSLTEQLKTPANAQLHSTPIGHLQCSKKSPIFSDGTIQCTLGSGPQGQLVLQGEAALDLMKKLDGFKAVIATENEEGENVVAHATRKPQPMGEKKATMEELSMSLNVHVGTLACKKTKLASSCAIQLSVLSIENLVVDLNN